MAFLVYTLNVFTIITTPACVQSVYDPSQPTTETRTLHQGEFVLDPRYQVRPSGTTNAVVGQYASDMGRGDRFPPLVAFEVDSEYILVDGWHRHSAGLRAGITEFEFIVHLNGTVQDAFAYSRFEANRNHGLPLTRKEKEIVIHSLCLEPEFCGMSSGELARRLGCSHTTVTKIRKKYGILPDTVVNSRGQVVKSSDSRSQVGCEEPEPEQITAPSPPTSVPVPPREFGGRMMGDIETALRVVRNEGFLPSVPMDQLDTVRDLIEQICKEKNGH